MTANDFAPKSRGLAPTGYCGYVPNLYATSDLHITHRGNEPFVDQIRPETPEDWLIVAGDVGERMGAVIDTLARLRERFATVVWVPGNHELWTTAKDPDQHRGETPLGRPANDTRGIPARITRLQRPPVITESVR